MYGTNFAYRLLVSFELVLYKCEVKWFLLLGFGVLSIVQIQMVVLALCH